MIGLQLGIVYWTSFSMSNDEQVQRQRVDCPLGSTQKLENDPLQMRLRMLMDRNEFARTFPFGVPFLNSTPNNHQVLILSFTRSREKFLYNDQSWNATSTSSVQLSLLQKHCRILNGVYNILPPRRPNDQNERTCTALVVAATLLDDPHVRKFIAPPSPKFTSLVRRSKSQQTGNEEPMSYRLALQGQYHNPSGDFTFLKLPPGKYKSKDAFKELLSYLSIFDTVMQELRPIAATAARSMRKNSSQPSNVNVDDSIIVMVSNFGHSDMMINYICAAQRAGIDLGKILLFATDPATQTLAQALGVAGVYYHPQLFGLIPEAASQNFGDEDYAKIMMAKIYCVHLVSMLGYNFLFQDVDIIPYSGQYLEYFIKKASQEEEYDMFFQYDHNNRLEYAPMSVNSGCYYIRNNARTRYFFSSLLQMGDVLLTVGSHQATTNLLLSRMANRYGLRVKTLQYEDELLPIGWHYLRRPEFMRKLIQSNKTKSLSLHYNWNSNKEIKREFFEQMGDWFVQDICQAKIMMSKPRKLSLELCCAKEPVVRCHYKDKASVKPCRESPAFSKGKSFW